MKLQGILSALSLVAVAGAAAPACPEGCEEDCCADGKKQHVKIVELLSDKDLHKIVDLADDDMLRNVQSIVRSGGDDDDISVVVKIVNDDVSASVNGKKIQPKQIIHKDGQIVIQIEGHDDIVVPMMSGGWETFKDAAPGFKWHTGGDGDVFFAPGGEENEFTVFQPSGVANRAIIGINISDADADMLKQLGIDGAIRIDGVIDGTPAAKAGIRANDLLLGLNGNRTVNVEQLQDLLSGKNPGDQVKVQVLRKGDKKNFEIRLAPSARFEDFAFGEQVIDLSPEFNVDIDVDDLLKDLKTKHGNLELHTDLHAEITDELKNKLKGLHIEMAPLHKEWQGKVFGELRQGVPQGDFMVAPRLRLHGGNTGVFDMGDGKTGVFRFEGGEKGGTFRFEHDGQHNKDLHVHNGGELDAKLRHLAERIERLEQRLDRLANALEKQ